MLFSYVCVKSGEIYIMTLFTEQHICLLRIGNKEAFHLLYDNFFIALCLFARHFNISKEEAEDLVQDVFCKLYHDQELPANLNAFKSYLYTSVRNRCLNFLRAEKRRKNNESIFYNLQHEDFFFDRIVESELGRQLHLLLNELPPQCKNIFERTLNGDTSEKIASDLNLSVETVKTQRKKAKKILRERYSLLNKIFGFLF